MTKALTREDAVAIVIDRAQYLYPEQLRQLAAELPVGIKEAITDFSATADLSAAERNLLLKHNVSIPWELMQYAQAKEEEPNIKVDWPPRNN